MSEGDQFITDTKLNRYKTGFVIFSITTGVLFVALVVSIFFNFTNYFNNNANNSKLTVEATSERKVETDTATATFNVLRRGPNSAEVNDALDIATTEVAKILETNGFSKDDIETNKNVFEEYSSFSSGGSMPDSRSYTGNLMVTVVFRGLKSGDTRPNEVLKKLNEVREVQFAGFSYNLDDTQSVCDDLEEEALTKAFAKGENRVKILQGKKIIKTNVLSITGCSNDQVFYPLEARMSGPMVDTSQAAPIFNNKLDMTVTAVVEFEYSL